MPSVAKPLNIWLIVPIVLLLWGGTRLWDALSADDRATGAEVEAPRQEVSELSGEKVAVNSEADQIFVCRASIAGVMGRELSIVSGTVRADGNIGTRYVRPSDGSIWQNVCRLDGERVMWASMDQGGVIGRWRNDPADEVISYVLTTKGVMITQSFSDSSTISEWFERE